MDDHDDDDWRGVRASDAEHAAEAFAERYDQSAGDYPILSGAHGGELVVLVRRPDDASVQRFSIEAESVPTYHATLQEASQEAE